MLAALVLAAIVAAPLSSASLFLPAHRPRRVTGAWPTARRLVSALTGTAVVSAVAGGALLLAGVRPATAAAAAAALVLASVVWLPATRRWNGRSHVAWASSVFLLVTYLIFILQWTFASHLGPVSTAGGLLLWLFEVVASMLACAYLWELCDALGSQRWDRRVTGAVEGPQTYVPFVSLQVPAHNEPPEMVIATLAALLELDYPAYEVIAIDDNTGDEAMWRPVADWCTAHGVKFVHLENWPGFKSGALNYALREMTDERAELIGVVDSDYQLHPGFLRGCAPLFADPKIGFIQAPQDYREWASARYYRRLYYSYKYFFTVSQPSRNERDGAIFAGTMGVIRRRALEEAGGWDEWCITEDAELSLRLLRAGWSGLHVDRSWGQGIMPLTFEALKSQRYRWCFGGIQILRMHWRSLLPGRRTRRNRLSLPQRWTYLAGGFQWYGDLLSLVFYLFLLAGAANLAAGGGQLFRRLTPFLVATVPVLVALGLARAIALLRRGTGASWRDAIGAFFVWQSTGLVVARASVAGLFARTAVFLRTPKISQTGGWRQALRGNRLETVLALCGVLGIAGALTRLTTLSGPLLAGLLAFPTLGLAAAPLNSVAASRAALPAHLQRRRQTEALRERRAVVRSATAATGLVATTATAAVLIALALAPAQIPAPHLLGPSRQNTPAPASPAASTSPSPSHSPTPTATTSPTPTPSATSAPASTPTASPSPTPTTASPTLTAPAGATPTSTLAPGATPAPTGTPAPSP